jgi:hypothetical protein
MHERNNWRMKTPATNSNRSWGGKPCAKAYRRKSFIIRGWFDVTLARVKLHAIFMN